MTEEELEGRVHELKAEGKDALQIAARLHIPLTKAREIIQRNAA